MTTQTMFDLLEQVTKLVQQEYGDNVRIELLVHNADNNNLINAMADGADQVGISPHTLTVYSSEYTPFPIYLKKSEILSKQAEESETVYQVMDLERKALREARLERFEDYIPRLEKQGCIIKPFNGQKTVIDTQTEQYGIIDFFPKANKLLIRKENAWRKPALRFIIENILI